MMDPFGGDLSPFGSPESLSSGSSSSSESNSPTPVPSMKAQPADRKILEELRTVLAKRYTTYHRYQDTIYWKRLINPNDPKLPVLDVVFKITQRFLNDAWEEHKKYEVVRLHDRVNSLDPPWSLAEHDGQQTSIEILRSHQYATTSSKIHWKTIFSMYNDLTAWNPYIAMTETEEDREARQWRENEMFMSIADGRKDAEAKVRNGYGLPGDGEESENKFLVQGERQRSQTSVLEKAERSKARELEAQESTEGLPSTAAKDDGASSKSNRTRSRSPASKGSKGTSSGADITPGISKSVASAQHPHSGAAQQRKKDALPDRLAETFISDETETKKKKGFHASK